MKNIYLKTTKLYIRQEEKFHKIINLGDWCINLQDRLNSNFTHHIKHLENKENIYLYLLNLKERIIFSLIDFLNDFHKIKKDYKYWNFIIGPWLLQLLHVTYDRWSVFSSHKELENQDLFTLIVDTPMENLIPDEMHLAKRFYYQDLWNHFLFGEIIKFKKQIQFEKISSDDQINLNKIVKNGNKIKFSFKNKLIDLFFFVNNIFNSQDKINKLIFTTNFHYKFQLKTFLKLKIFPIFLKSPPSYGENQINYGIRKKVINFDANSNYENFLEKNICKFMPKSLIENYNEILKVNLKFYKNFKTRNFFISQLETIDQIKFYIAESQNSKRIIYQHGGNYGLSKFHFREQIEIEASDYYLTFGWGKAQAMEYLNLEDKNKIINFYPIHLLNELNPSPKKDFLYLVLDEFPNYFYEYHPNYDAHSYKLYFKNIINFIKNLDLDNRKKLIIRLYPQKFNPDIPKILKNCFPEIKIDYANSDFISQVSKAKLCIIANNSTTFLQTLRLNIPTIIFWDDKIVRLRSTPSKNFENLKKCGIFYNNPLDAAIFCNKNKKVYKWWSSSQNKKIVDDFVNEFASKDETKINKLISIIKNEK